MIKRDEMLQPLLYVATALVSVSLAFFVSLKYVTHLHAQTISPTMPAAASVATPNAGSSTSPTQSNDNSDLAGFLEPFIYDSTNRRDPFMPFADYLPSNNAPQMGLTLAQKYSLSQLKLVGIMWDIRNPKAMFTDPNADVIVLGRDESIGNRNGYIASIREGEVVVVESVRRRGNVVYRTRVLRLRR